MTEGGAVLGLLLLLVLAVAAVCLYFLPTIIAVKSGAANQIAILFLNLFVGWTLIGWLVALFWALAGAGAATASREAAGIAAAHAVSQFKTCPRCAEEVRSAAVVCRYCGYEFPLLLTNRLVDERAVQPGPALRADPAVPKRTPIIQPLRAPRDERRGRDRRWFGSSRGDGC